MDTQTVFDWESEIEDSRAAFLNGLLLIATVVGLAAIASTYVTLPEGMTTLERLVEVTPFLAGWLIVLIVWVWRGLGYSIRAPIVLLIVYALSVFIFRRGGLSGSGRVWLLLLPALVFILLGARSGVIAGVVGILTYVIFAIAFSQKWLLPLVSEDPSALTTWFSEGGSFLLITISLTLVLWSYGRGWLEALARMSTTSQQLQDQTRELGVTNEQLRLQTAKLQTVAEIIHAGSAIMDTEKMFAEVVNRIQAGFEDMGVYHVTLFLIDDVDEQVVTLKAATGEAGQLLLEMGHKLVLDDTTLIGRCMARREASVASNLEEGTVQYDAVPMPHTRSEVALPLRFRNRILGALSVQSTREAVFEESDVAVLQMMADQVAVAIDNARSLSRTEAALAEVQAAHSRYLIEAWEEFLSTGAGAQVDYTQPGMDMGDDEFLREARHAAMMHERVVALDGFSRDAGGKDSAPQTALVAPLKLRGQVVGTMTLHETRHPRSWKTGEIAMLETVAEQVALSVENLRLMDETQRRAAREQLVGKITTRMQRATDMESLMRVTVEELNRVLGGSRAYARLGAAAELADGSDKSR